MTAHHANRPGADPSKDLPETRFRPKNSHPPCGQQLQSYGYCNQSTLTPAAASGNYQAGATFYPHMNNHLQQGRFQAGYIDLGGGQSAGSPLTPS